MSDRPSFDAAGRTVNQPSRPRWWTHGLPLFVALLVLLGVGVRVRHYLAAPSYWYDEAYLLLNVFDKSYGELIGPLRDDQAGPPLYLWTLRFLYVRFGSSEYVMRLPAFLAGLLALCVMILLARRMVRPAGWLWAVGLCAVCAHGVFHGAEVKPYTWDLLATLFILFTAHQCLARESVDRWPWLVLLGLAFVSPWASLPSVFVLVGVSAAILVQTCHRRERAWLLGWVAFNAVCLLTSAALWFLVLRHQRTSSLQTYWDEFFGDYSSPLAGVRSACTCLIGVGNYGSNGLGIPLLLLGGVGAVALYRRSVAIAVLLTASVVVAMMASALRYYPLADRLAFFLVPCVWLLAAEGVGVLAEVLLARRWNQAVIVTGVLVLAALLLPGAVQFGKLLVVVVPRNPFRDAIQYVEQRRQPGDLCWVSHPQVFEVYRGKSESCLGGYTPIPEVVRQAGGHRLWLIAAVGPNGAGSVPELEAQLQQAGMTGGPACQYPGMVVLFYSSDSEPRSE